jgi:hypothetical protein
VEFRYFILLKVHFMKSQRNFFWLSSIGIVILLGAIVKFAIHLYYAPEYGFFGDELYTIALSQHLAFGYVDLPPLVPALVALSRALLGDSLFAHHILSGSRRSHNTGLHGTDHKRVLGQDLRRLTECAWVHRRSHLAGS